MNDRELTKELCQYYKFKEKDGKALCNIKRRILGACRHDEKRPFIRHIDPDDLNNAAILGIIEGINTYDAEKGLSFKLTEQSLEDLRNENVPDDVLDELKPFVNQRIKDEENFLDVIEEYIGKEQTINHKELILRYAEKGMKLTTWCTFKMKEQIRYVISQELKFVRSKDQESLSEGSVVPIDQSKIQLLIKALKKIPSKQAVVIRRYVGIDKASNGKRQTFSHIGKDIGLSKQRVQQIYQQGIKNLRKEFLKVYPESFRN